MITLLDSLCKEARNVLELFARTIGARHPMELNARMCAGRVIEFKADGPENLEPAA
jgi:hypothetical protein